MLSEHCENNHPRLKNNKKQQDTPEPLHREVSNKHPHRIHLYSELPFPLMATYAYLWEFGKVIREKAFQCPCDSERISHGHCLRWAARIWVSQRLGHTRPMWPVFDKARCSQVGSPPVQSKGKLEVLCPKPYQIIISEPGKVPQCWQKSSKLLFSVKRIRLIEYLHTMAPLSCFSNDRLLRTNLWLYHQLMTRYCSKISCGLSLFVRNHCLTVRLLGSNI